MIKKYLFAVVAILIMSQMIGCAAFIEGYQRAEAERRAHPHYYGYDAVCNSWMGNSIDDLVRSWGPPSQISSLNSGNKIYVWVKTGGATTVQFGQGLPANTYINYCKTWFEVSQEGQVVQWRYEGNMCR